MHNESFLKRINNPRGLVKPMEEHIAHFKKRLKERFNIEITTEEYDELVGSIAYAKNIYHLNSSNIVYSLMIKGVEVWVIYAKTNDKLPSRLKTAMVPFKNLLVPDCLAHKYNNMMFTQRVGELIVEITEISKLVDLNNVKEFFIGHQEISPLMKSLALQFKKYDNAWDIRFLRGVIRHLTTTEGVPFMISNIPQ